MAVADTARMLAVLDLKDGLTPVVRTMGKSLDKLDSRISKTQGRAFKAGQQIGTGIKVGAAVAVAGIGILATQVAAGLNQLAELEDVTTATNTALASTGAVAGVTAGDIRRLAEQYENLNATMDDKVIQSGENLLLTFTNIRKEAFEPALAAALDLNTAMGGGAEGLQKTIIQVGKALNDPARGFTALRRVGVSFTADQEKQIKALQKAGKLFEAQQIILKELGTEFGGRFAAQGKTARGTIAGIGDAVEDLQKAVATGLFPVVQKLLPRVRDALTDPRFIAAAQNLGDNIAALFTDENINTGVRTLEGFFRTAQSVAPVLASAAGTMGDIIKTSVDLFRSLPPEIQALAVAGFAVNKLTGGLVTNIAGGLISAVISSFKGLMNVNAAVVNVNGPVAPGGGSILDTVKNVLPAVLPFVVTRVVPLVAAALAVQGDVAQPGEDAKFVEMLKRMQAAGRGAEKISPTETVDQALQRLTGSANAASAALRALQTGPTGDAQDTAEKAQQRRNAAFNSIPTRTDLRARIATNQAALKGAKGSDITRLRHDIGVDQRRLAKRIADAAAKAQSQADALTRAVRGVSDTIQSSKPVVNLTVPVATYINGRLIESNLNRYTSVVGGIDLARGIIP